MKVLVIGATGFIGRHLVRALVSEGHQVLAASPRPLDWGDAPGATPCQLDITSPHSFRDLPDNVDVVVHVATARQGRIADRRSMAWLLEVNVRSTLNLLDYVRRRRIPRLVYCSSMSVYSPNQTLPISEEGATYPSDTLDSAYGIAKLCAELLCAQTRRGSAG